MTEVDIEIQRIDEEISTLEVIRQRLYAVRERQANSSIGNSTEPKVRKTRKRRSAGLPSATPPPSEANLVGRL